MKPIDDEIDLREICAALKRRWRWLVGCTISGLVLGGVVALMQRGQVKVSMFIDMSKGPQAPAPISFGNADSPGPLLVVTNYEPKYHKQDAIILLRSLVVSVNMTPDQRKHVKIGDPTDKALKSDELLEVTATVSSAQAPYYQAMFENLARDLLRKSEKDLSSTDAPAQSDFVRHQSVENVPYRAEFAVALGG